MPKRSGPRRKRSLNAPKQKCKKTKNKRAFQPCILRETPMKKVRVDDVISCPKPVSSRPLVQLFYRPNSESDTLWQMLKPNSKYRKDFMLRHPSILPGMRTVLLDWLIEVCEAYTLHRQTFSLAQDYFDRFMLTQNHVEKHLLQLIGVTCLLIASKIEEARPLKVAQMVDVTADSYSEEEIVEMELRILKALEWKMWSETSLSWLNAYFQLASVSAGADLLVPQFSPDVYLQMTRLLDLCVLEIKSLDYQRHVLAGSVMCHFIDSESVESVSSLPFQCFKSCVKWMTPYAETVHWFGRATQRDFAGVKTEDKYNIQTHTDYMSMLFYTYDKRLGTGFPRLPGYTELQDTQ
ncbi:G1/S-specific cyclin-E2-like [Antennarius striatus]|uniref:G1/S-specific cyclin-E2-like n=1 Tax=Antennarius striatus TaxID=241820 RepID=UPI0035B10FF3